MRLEKTYITCRRCGNSNLSFDASADWNVRLQKFEYSVTGTVWCNDCEDDCDTEETVIVNQKLLNINVL